MAATTASVVVDPSGEPRTNEDLLLLAWTHEALTGVRIHLPDGSLSSNRQRTEEDTWPG